MYAPLLVEPSVRILACVWFVNSIYYYFYIETLVLDLKTLQIPMEFEHLSSCNDMI